MSLEPAAGPARLYSAVGAEVNRHRPLFTGDVFLRVDIPGVGTSPAIVIAHPWPPSRRDRYVEGGWSGDAPSLSDSVSGRRSRRGAGGVTARRFWRMSP